MKSINYIYKITGQIYFVIIFLLVSPAQSLDKFSKSNNISDYFSGILLLNENQYDKSFDFLRKLNGLEASHSNYSVKYLHSLINSKKFKEAFNYSRRLEKQKLDNFESDLITGIFYLKNSNTLLAQRYFLKAKKRKSRFILNNYVLNSLYFWSSINDFDLSKSINELDKIDVRFENLKKIQTVFLNCYFNSPNTKNSFKSLISDKETDFSRYNYFYASYLYDIGSMDEARDVINSALKIYPRNLLLNQYKLDLDKNTNKQSFNCKNAGHTVAEILYITANALSSQSIYSLSNFYLNLAKYLNEDFNSYETLVAENLYKINNYDEAKKIYNNLNKKGKAFQWYSSKQLARIYLKEDDQDKALELISNAYKNLSQKDIYDTFDYAEFLKNNEKFKQSIIYYTEIINKIKKDHPLYADVTDGRGVAHERIDEWKKAEKDLLSSLEAEPDQAYVINYLAYSWIEQGIKIQKSLEMLRKANELRSNDPYITDSLGWALFKLEKFKEAKEYLQLAVKLLPGDPIVNDHYGDALWKNGDEIQARYYWNFVLGLKNTEEELKKTIKEKLIKGL